MFGSPCSIMVFCKRAGSNKRGERGGGGGGGGAGCTSLAEAYRVVKSNWSSVAPR